MFKVPERSREFRQDDVEFELPVLEDVDGNTALEMSMDGNNVALAEIFFHNFRMEDLCSV